MDEKKKKKMDNDPVSWSTAEEEMKESAPADLLKKEDPELLKKDIWRCRVNPPGSGGAKLKSKKK